MATTTADNIQIIGGVDTHQDLHTAAVVSHDGTVLGTESFSTTRAGYRAMLRWFRSHGELLRVGVESTGTYGAGITRHLALSGIPVLEVTGPDPASRRAKGKDDALDAISAAEAARTRRRVQVAKDRSGTEQAVGLGLYLRGHLGRLRLCRLSHRRLCPPHRRLAGEPDSPCRLCSRCPGTSTSCAATTPSTLPLSLPLPGRP